tara:strand:+ start:5199 stop:6086 length:888 start_codon:yes stop_codon:yes gene_type:complete
MKSKVLVIGSKGFIGSNLVKHLELNGYDVWKCDISLESSPKYISINIQDTNFDDAFREIFDVCINCSGAADVPASLKKPLHDFILNTDNVFKILDSIKSFSPDCKFINLSSAAVYGNPQALPIKEDSQLAPVSPYGWHKLYAEQICREFHENYNIRTISLRIFSAYGEGIRKQLLWDVYQKSLLSDKVNFWGTGKETRDFIYIADLLQAIQVVIEHAEFDGTAINVANGEETLVETVVSQTLQQLKWQGEYFFTGEKRKGDPTRWLANIDNLLSLGYKRKYSFEQGVENYCQWLK